MEDTDYHEMALKVRDMSDQLAADADSNSDVREIQSILDDVATKMESVGSSLV